MCNTYVSTKWLSWYFRCTYILYAANVENFTDGKVSFNSLQSFRGLLIPLNLKQNHDHEHKHQVSLTAMVESRVKLFEMDSRTGRY